MKKIQSLCKALFAAAALALALPSCSDLDTANEHTVLVTEEGKVGVSLSFGTNYRTLISAFDESALKATLSIKPKAEDTEEESEELTLDIASFEDGQVVAYKTADTAYEFALSVYAEAEDGTKTTVLAGKTEKTITATDAAVTIVLAAAQGESVDVTLHVTYAAGYGVQSVKVAAYTDSALTTASADDKDSLSATAVTGENVTVDGAYTVSGSLASGATKWVRVQLLAEDDTVLGSKTVAIFPIATGDIEETLSVSVAQYQASVSIVTTETTAPTVTLKNTALKGEEGYADDYEGISLTPASETSPFAYSGIVPVGTYDVFIGGTLSGQLKDITPYTVDTSITLSDITVAWKDTTQPTFYTGTSLDLIKERLSVTADPDTITFSSFGVTGYNAETSGSQTLTVSATYNGVTKTKEITVEITAITLKSISLAEDSAQKTEYTVGETSIDLSGLKLQLLYNNDSAATVVYDNDNITATKYFKDTDGNQGDEVSDFTTVMATAGTYWVQVTYEGQNASYKISVKPAGVTLYKFGTALSDAAKTAKSYTFSTDNDVLIFDTPLNLNEGTKASIKATFTATSAKVGVGFVSFADGKAYSNSTISYRVFGTNQGVRYLTSDAAKWNGSSYSSAVQTSPYTVMADINVTTAKKMTFSILGIVNDKETTSSKNDSLTKWITDATKPVYLAIGTETGTASLDLSSIEITIYDGGTPQTYNVASLADLPEDTRASLSPSTTELSYTIASSVSGNKGDATTITLTDDLLSAVKAKNGDTEVAGTWKWATTSASLAAGKSSVTAKANFTPEDTSAYKSITAQEFTITVTDEREEKPEDEVVSVTWNFASPSTLAAYGTATANTNANKVTYSGEKTYASNTVSDTTYFTASSASISLLVKGSIRDNGNSAQIGSSNYIYVPVSAGSVMTVTGFDNYTNYTVTLNGEKTENVPTAGAKQFTAKTAGFAKIEGGSKDEQNSKTDNYIVSISVTNITRADIIKLYGKEAENIATFPTPDEPTVTIAGDNTVTIATDAETATLDLTATLNNAGNAEVTWTSSEEAIATVAANESDSTKATVTAKAEGTVTITASITVGEQTYSGTFTITVNKGASVSSHELTVTSALSSGTKGTFTQIGSTIFFSDTMKTASATVSSYEGAGSFEFMVIFKKSSMFQITSGKLGNATGITVQNGLKFTTTGPAVLTAYVAQSADADSKGNAYAVRIDLKQISNDALVAVSDATLTIEGKSATLGTTELGYEDGKIKQVVISIPTKGTYYFGDTGSGKLNIYALDVVF